MANGDENNLTCTDAFGIMCSDIRAIARELGFGTLWFPQKDNPSLICKVHNGLIKQVDIILRGDNGIDKTKTYRAD